MSALNQPQWTESLALLEAALAAVRSQFEERRGRLLTDAVDQVGSMAEPNRTDARALLAKAKHLYRARRMREAVFRQLGLFGDPAWDILLDLFIHWAEKREVSVSSAAIASCVAPTTALRWINRLVQDDMIARIPDPLDRRRSYLRLSQRGCEMMTNALAHF